MSLSFHVNRNGANAHDDSPNDLSGPHKRILSTPRHATGRRFSIKSARNRTRRMFMARALSRGLVAGALVLLLQPRAEAYGWGLHAYGVPCAPVYRVAYYCPVTCLSVPIYCPPLVPLHPYPPIPPPPSPYA